MRQLGVTVLAGLTGALAAAGDLTVVVSGAGPVAGQVVATLFDAPERWMREPLAQANAHVAGAGSAAIGFSGIDPGSYAVSIIHDKNSNGSRETNFLGIPTEAFGFSNNARALFGPRIGKRPPSR